MSKRRQQLARCSAGASDVRNELINRSRKRRARLCAARTTYHGGWPHLLLWPTWQGLMTARKSTAAATGNMVPAEDGGLRVCASFMREGAHLSSRCKADMRNDGGHDGNSTVSAPRIWWMRIGSHRPRAAAACQRRLSWQSRPISSLMAWASSQQCHWGWVVSPPCTTEGYQGGVRGRLFSRPPQCKDMHAQ